MESARLNNKPKRFTYDLHVWVLLSRSTREAIEAYSDGTLVCEECEIIVYYAEYYKPLVHAEHSLCSNGSVDVITGERQ